jgi:hypothetical protein
MEDKGKIEARRWLSRQLAWEATLDRLVGAWEKEQGVERHPSSRARRRGERAPGLPLEKPAA